VVDRNEDRLTHTPDDRKFAALAHAAGATLISIHDHLLGCRLVLPVTVLTAGAFWEMLRRSRTASDS
jgi:predicted nucleic acid-binding protein